MTTQTHWTAGRVREEQPDVFVQIGDRVAPYSTRGQGCNKDFTVVHGNQYLSFSWHEVAEALNEAKPLKTGIKDTALVERLRASDELRKAGLLEQMQGIARRKIGQVGPPDEADLRAAIGIEIDDILERMVLDRDYATPASTGRVARLVGILLRT